MVGLHTERDIQRLYYRQNGRCVYCDCKLTPETARKDHIIPVSKGGSNFIGNIQLLCGSCNAKKHARLPIAYKRALALVAGYSPQA